MVLAPRAFSTGTANSAPYDEPELKRGAARLKRGGTTPMAVLFTTPLQRSALSLLVLAASPIGALAQQPAPPPAAPAAPAAEAPAGPTAMSTPAMSGPLVANPDPYHLDVKPFFGPVYVTGVAS